MKPLCLLISLAFGLQAAEEPRKPLAPYYEQHRARIEAGDGIALYELYLEQRNIGCPVPFKQNVFQLLRNQIEKDGNPRAMAYLGMALLAQNNRAPQPDRMEGAQWLRKAAEKKDYKALEQMANFHFTGQHGDLFPKDLKLAEKLAVQSMDVRLELAKNGDTQAIWDLYSRKVGRSLPIDYLKSMNPNQFEWVGRAAEAGHLKAMAEHGGRLEAEGQRKKDQALVEKGRKLWEATAEANEETMMHMAMYHFQGIGGYPKDPAKAWYWIDRWMAYTGCDGIIHNLKEELGELFVPRPKGGPKAKR